jgi:HAMP domain-containing protein
MRAWLVFVAAIAAATASAQDPATSGSLERPFSANGRVKMDLVAGDYHITGSPDRRVRIEWSARDADAFRRVDARADVREKELTITTNGPSNRSLKFNIQLPNLSDLYVRLSAGDLTIEDIRGNKDVELRAGDLRIDVGRAEDYNKVDASLWAGDLKATAFQVIKEGLFRSFDWSGNGPYRLHAHLMAGDLYLYSKAADGR